MLLAHTSISHYVRRVVAHALCRASPGFRLNPAVVRVVHAVYDVQVLF